MERLTWEQTKTLALKGSVALLVAWGSWSMKQGFRATEQLRDAVTDLRVVVAEVKTSLQTNREQIGDMKADTNQKIAALERRIETMEQRH